MTIEQQNQFVEMITPLFRAQESLLDLFFKIRLSEEIGFVIKGYTQYHVERSKGSLLVYVKNLKDLDRLLEEIIYLEKGNITQFTFSRKEALSYGLHFLREINAQKQLSVKNNITKEPIVIGSKSVDPLNEPPTKTQKVKNNDKLNKTQEKILEFVRRSPDARTKDVVNQFSALSGRTIIRSLKELSDGGRIIKRFDGSAVYYSAN